MTERRDRPTPPAARVRVGLYGGNGHQIQGALASHPLAELAAVVALPRAALPEGVAPREYDSLDALLRDPTIELVSLCSPRRADQARDAIRCLEAGKHVYAEKPSALTERDLDALIAAVHRTGRQYREMGFTYLDQPYREMRRQALGGAIGTIVQVLAQKSYPWHENRPADEDVDGGLALQVGVYAARFVEHVAGIPIASLDMVETRLGNPIPDSACRMAVSMIMRLANGGVASAVCNYLNPMRQVCWGYEIVRLFGTRGILESNADGNRARLILTGEPPRELTPSDPPVDGFTIFAASLRGGPALPLTLEEDLSPTRWVIRARAASRSGG